MLNRLLACAAGSAAVSSVLAPAASAHELSVELVASGLTRPVALCAPAGDAHRIFVAEQHAGRIRIVRDDQLLPQPFLDIGALVSNGVEQGLLSFAFHPDYAANGRFFVSYTDLHGDSRIVEHTVTADPDVADPTPVQTILVQGQPYPLHNGGHLAFGGDGMLYVALGDGGTPLDDRNLAQSGATNLGKLLRLDVDLPPPFVPPDNPFVGDPLVRDEIWARGLRNPWRYSFDRETGDLWLADVGEDRWEEIDFQPASSSGGENYGWRCMEGSACTDLGGCSCSNGNLVKPVYEHPHDASGCSVIGGYVYRGSAIHWFRGRYLFGDWCSGRLWSFRHHDGVVTELVERTDELEPAGPITIDRIVSFGEDALGELYVLDGKDGEVYRVVGACEDLRYCRAELNSSGAPGAISRSGSLSIAANDLTLLASQCPANEIGCFFYGGATMDAPFGNGRRCVAGGGRGVFVVGAPVQLASTGDGARQLDFTVPPASSGPGEITPGSTWFFQFWFRDTAAGGARLNLTDAMSILFCP